MGEGGGGHTHARTDALTRHYVRMGSGLGGSGGRTHHCCSHFSSPFHGVAPHPSLSIYSEYTYLSPGICLSLTLSLSLCLSGPFKDGVFGDASWTALAEGACPELELLWINAPSTRKDGDETWLGTTLADPSIIRRALSPGSSSLLAQRLKLCMVNPDKKIASRYVRKMLHDYMVYGVGGWRVYTPS